MISYEERVKRVNNHPIILKRGKLFRNWWNHASVLGIVSALTCPECGGLAENLVWKCHGMTIQEAVDQAHQRYQEALNDEEDNETLTKFKEEVGWSSQSGGI